MPIRQDELEQHIAIQITDDKLTAYLQFMQANKDLNFTLDQLEALLKSNGVVHGILYDKCASIAKNPQQFFYDKTIVAVGDQPKLGEDGKIEYFFQKDADSRTPMELTDGTVDLKQVMNLNNVKKGDLLAARTEPKEGLPGRAVTGEVLPAKKGRTMHFRVGKNVTMNEEKTKLFADIDGLVSLTDNKINVFPIYEVNGDVDYAIGNIDFVGTVLVRGNVLNGFQVKAKGDIRVIGGVEGAELYADGTIEISAGVLGFNKGYIKAGKDVKSSFIQDANVEAGNNVLVTQSIMHSNIRAGENVICEGKGLIVGGKIQAGGMVSARTIGNTMSTATVIEVGVLPHLRNELQQLREDLKVLNGNLLKTEQALKLLDQLAAHGQLDDAKAAMRARLTTTRKQSALQLTEMKERILEIEKSLEQTDNAKVEVKGSIYGGTKIVIGRNSRFIKDTLKRVTFISADGDIVY